MKKTLLVLSITLLGSLFGTHVMGQTTQTSIQNLTLGMPEVLLVSASSTPVSLVLTTNIAGNAVAQSASNNSARLLISSVILVDQTRKLTAKVNAVPDGTTLTLQAQTPSTNFTGTPGVYADAQTLSTTGEATIITAIGSCYSGTTVGDGYVLNYTWGLNDPATNYGLVRATGTGTTTAVVTLTLSAGA